MTNHLGGQIVYKSLDPVKNGVCTISNITNVARTRIRPFSVRARSIWIACMSTGDTFINIIARYFTEFISDVTFAIKGPDRVNATGILSAIVGAGNTLIVI